MRLPLVVVTLLAAALPMCGVGSPAPPPVDDLEEACLPEVCLDYPAGWELVEEGDGFLTLGHPLHPDILASLSRVSMEAISDSAGGSWPTSVESVVRDFWSLLAEGQEVSLEEVSREPDGSVVSRGTVGGQVLWHELIPIGAGPEAWSLAVRAPNVAWEPHARVFLDGVTFR